MVINFEGGTGDSEELEGLLLSGFIFIFMAEVGNPLEGGGA